MIRVLAPGRACWLLLSVVLVALTGPSSAAASSVTATSWIELDGSGTRDGLSRNATGVRTSEHDVSAAVDPDGNPVVAYVDAQSGNVVVKQLIDDVWQQLGTTPGPGVTPRVKVHTDGTINVAWLGPTAVFLARWTGTTWAGLAGSNAGNGLTGAVNPRSFGLALDLAGDPIVVFDALPAGANECSVDGSVGLTGEQVYAVQWNGTAWVYLGSDASGGGASNALSFAIPSAGQSVCHAAVTPTVAVGSDGLPVVAFVYTTASNQADLGDDFFVGTNTDIYAVRWDGVAWVALGPEVPTEPAGPGLGLAGGLSNNANASALPDTEVPPASPTVAIGADNRPLVAWSDNSTSPDETRIFVRKFSEDVRTFNSTTASWDAIGTDSGVKVGISPLTGTNSAPQIAISPSGTPRIAWTTVGSSGRLAVYVKRLVSVTANRSTTTSWLEETVGAASGTGINGPSVEGGPAALAFADDGTGGAFVAWLARGVSVPQVFARRTAAGATAATLNVTMAGSGSGSVTSQPLGIDCPAAAGGCSQVFPTGTIVTLTATPDPGLGFSGWSGACTNAVGPCAITLSANTTVTANFLGAKLTVSTSGSGTGIVVSSPGGISCGLDCTQAFPVGSTVTVTATAFAGSTFEGWSGCVSPSGPDGVVCEVIMTNARRLIANFSSARLTVVKAGTGSGTVTGTAEPGTSAPINCGSVCGSSNAINTPLVLTATPAQGSTFQSWSGCTSFSGNTCSVTMSSSRTVTATFTTARLTVVRAGTGTGTVTGVASPSNGTSVPISCGATCASNNATGTTVTLTAVPNVDSAFQSWSGCPSAAANVCTVALTTSARTVTANFASNTLTVTRNGAGTVVGIDPGAAINCGSGTSCVQKFPPGTTVHLQANNTDPTAAFTRWNGCTSTNGSTCTVLMSLSRTVTATFTSNELKVALAGVGGGTGTVAGVGNAIACAPTCAAKFPPNAVATLTAAPAQGAVFTRWSGCTNANGSTCTVLMNTAKSVTATFTSVTLTLGISGAGSVTSQPAGISCAQSCAGHFVPNATVVLTATPTSTSVFTSWSGCASIAGNTCTVTLNVAKAVTATFTSRTLTIVKTSVNGGSGTVTGPGFTCTQPLCSQDFPPDTPVTVTAVPNVTSGFTGWSGCSSTSGPGNTSCNVTLNVARTVTATFARFNLSVTRSGAGTVQDGDSLINCGSACKAAFAAGKTVTLTATPSTGYGLVGFTGCTPVGNASCTVLMNQSRAVSVKFASFTLSVSTTGAGTVTSDTGGIACKPTCSAPYPPNTTVTLTAAPSGGSTFAGFTGCASTPTPSTCTVVMSQARSVRATFTSP